MTTRSGKKDKVLMELPDDQPLLAAAGRVALAHGHLELMLGRTIKTLANLNVANGDAATRGKKNWELRQRIEQLFKQHTTDRVLWTKLDSILGECMQVSEQRNELIHSVWALTSDDTYVVSSGSGGWKNAPSAERLNQLAQKIENLVRRINEERLHGFIREVADAVFSTKKRKK